MAPYKKLVRDRIPEIIKGKGEVPITRKLKKEEYKIELLRKLIEESGELQSAKNRLEQVGELADIQEVLTALYTALKIDCSEVTKLARKKRKERGGFEKRIYLEGVKKK